MTSNKFSVQGNLVDLDSRRVYPAEVVVSDGRIAAIDQLAHSCSHYLLPGFVDSLAASDDHTAFFGSLGFNGSYWVGGNWAVRAGYNLMWLEGVALAPPQIPVNNLIAPGTSGIDTGSGLFFHGASVGLVATW